MSKIKKIFTSFTFMIAGTISKVFAIEPKYGVSTPDLELERMRGKISSVGKFIIPIISFVIGLFVVFNKKINKKTKVIIVSVLAILVIFGYILMNYIATNL
ncbi:MAG: hypothetical protein PUI29_11755 [Aeromonadales bacterium]|nr:hypothetical protein [Aeromonadales bacterium]